MNTQNFILIVSICLRVAAAAVMVFNVLPRAWRESQVPNGLGMLRKIIFLGILLFTAVNVFVTAVNAGRASGVFMEDIIGVISFVNGIAEVLLAGALYLIYNHDYGREKR